MAGHGLGYTRFSYADLEVTGSATVTASFTVVNVGSRSGADVPQLYLVDAPGDRRMRLLGFERVELEAGGSRRLTFIADARLLARFDAASGQWLIAAGTHRVSVGRSAGDLALSADPELEGRRFGS